MVMVKVVVVRTLAGVSNHCYVTDIDIVTGWSDKLPSLHSELPLPKLLLVIITISWYYQYHWSGTFCNKRQIAKNDGSKFDTISIYDLLKCIHFNNI